MAVPRYRAPADGNGMARVLLIIGAAFGGIIIAAMQAVLFWWVSDQTTSVRALGKELLELRGSVEAYKQTQAATTTAMQPFANADRLTLNRVDKAIDEQTRKVDYTVTLVQDMNKVLQELGAAQVALKGNLERLEDRVLSRGERGFP